MARCCTGMSAMCVHCATELHWHCPWQQSLWSIVVAASSQQLWSDKWWLLALCSWGIVGAGCSQSAVADDIPWCWFDVFTMALCVMLCVIWPCISISCTDALLPKGNIVRDNTIKWKINVRIRPKLVKITSGLADILPLVYKSSIRESFVTEQALVIAGICLFSDGLK